MSIGHQIFHRICKIRVNTFNAFEVETIGNHEKAIFFVNVKTIQCCPENKIRRKKRQYQAQGTLRSGGNPIELST